MMLRMKALVRSQGATRASRIAVFGDSHTAALSSAKDFPERRALYENIEIFRLLKEKDGKSIGDSTLERFLSEIRGLEVQDLVFSAVGGNQYAIVSTVRDPVEYDFVSSPEDRSGIDTGASLVPHRALFGYIRKGVRGTIGPVLKAIRASTGASFYHLAPPPPKEDNRFIATHFETRFARQGIQDLGPTRPALRLKCWKMQLQCLAELCDELDIGLVLPPERGVTAEGFLAPRCYAKDVTHANRRYGEFVLKQMLELAAADRAGNEVR
jgi:hypothetical protein